jgi:HNH endonuclease
LRTSDKAALFRRFKYPVIAHAKKNQLLSLFADKCFRCHTSAGLELDHHVPQKKGGRLVPGNVVVLCGKCNIKKRDTLPEEFYSASELEALTPLLIKELQFFEFHFDWSMWYHNPLAYLVTLGVEPEMARCAIYEPNHPMFVPHPINRHLLSTDELDASTMPGLTIGVDTEIPDRE